MVRVRRRGIAIAVVALVLAGCAGGPAGAAAGPVAPGLSDGSGSPTALASDAALRGTVWLVTAATVDGKAIKVPGPFDPPGGLTLSIDDGSLSGFDGCNWFNGAASSSAKTVTPSVMMSSTAMMCPDRTLTPAYLRVIRNPFPWSLHVDDLRIGSEDGDHFDFVPFPEGFPSEVAGQNNPTIATGTVGGVRYRVYTSSETPGGDLCIMLEFWNKPGENERPAGACRDTGSARRYVVNPTDFSSGTTRGRGVVLGAVPSGTAARIVVNQKSGNAVELKIAPIPGTDYLAFYGFVPNPQHADTALFYDRDDTVIDPAWTLYW